MDTKSIETIGHIGTVRTDEPTPLLRWKNGILQQAWRVQEWRSGMNQTNAQDWRDVPHEMT